MNEIWAKQKFILINIVGKLIPSAPRPLLLLGISDLFYIALRGCLTSSSTDGGRAGKVALTLTKGETIDSSH